MDSSISWMYHALPSRRQSTTMSLLTIHWLKCRFRLLNHFQHYKNRTNIYNRKQRLSKVESKERMCKIRARFQQNFYYHKLGSNLVSTRTIYFWAVPLAHALFREHRTLSSKPSPFELLYGGRLIPNWRISFFSIFQIAEPVYRLSLVLRMTIELLLKRTEKK